MPHKPHSKPKVARFYPIRWEGIDEKLARISVWAWAISMLIVAGFLLFVAFDQRIDIIKPWQALAGAVACLIVSAGSFYVAIFHTGRRRIKNQRKKFDQEYYRKRREAKAGAAPEIRPASSAGLPEKQYIERKKLE